MRSTRTLIIGKIKLIESGSGLVTGECELIGCHKVSRELALRSFKNHRVKDLSLLEKWCWAWQIKNAIRYENPVSYKHPRGAVIWVNL